MESKKLTIEDLKRLHTRTGEALATRDSLRRQVRADRDKLEQDQALLADAERAYAELEEQSAAQAERSIQ